MAKYEIELDDETAKDLSRNPLGAWCGEDPEIVPARVIDCVQTIVRRRNLPFEELDRAKTILRAHCMGLVAKAGREKAGYSIEHEAEILLNAMLGGR